MKVFMWGDNLAVRLPKKLVEKLGLAAGDRINVTSADEQTIMVAKNTADEGDFLRKLRVLQKPKPEGFVWNRDDANAR